jgi:hypothetical protein
MLNRLLMVIHWVLFLWVLGWPFGIINALLGEPVYITRAAIEFLQIGSGLAVVYIILLWIIKHRWIWFPWQHNKD